MSKEPSAAVVETYMHPEAGPCEDVVFSGTEAECVRYKRANSHEPLRIIRERDSLVQLGLIHEEPPQDPHRVVDRLGMTEWEERGDA